MVGELKSSHCALAVLRVRDGHEIGAVLEQLRNLQVLTRQEAGCRRFDFFQSLADPGHLWLLEAFVDEAAFTRHLEAPYTQAYFALRMTELVERTPLRELDANGDA